MFDSNLSDFYIKKQIIRHYYAFKHCMNVRDDFIVTNELSKNVFVHTKTKLNEPTASFRMIRQINELSSISFTNL